MDNLTLDDALEIANIGVEFGRVVADATRYPMDVSKRDELLEQMKPYKEIFQPMVQAFAIDVRYWRASFLDILQHRTRKDCFVSS